MSGDPRIPFPRRYGPAENEDRKARDARVMEELRSLLYDLAFTAEREETRITAATALGNRIEGTPVARNLTVLTDELSKLSDAELDRESARVERMARAIASGEMAPDVQK